VNYKRKEKENISNYKIIEVLGSEKEPEFEFFTMFTLIEFQGSIL